MKYARVRLTSVRIPVKYTCTHEIVMMSTNIYQCGALSRAIDYRCKYQKKYIFARQYTIVV